jgi:uncharacterized membrane protein
MTLRAIVLIVLLAVVAAFSIVNWSAITTPTPVSLGVATVQAPLALIMLVFLVVVSGVFLLLMLLQYAAVIRETRRYAKELAAQRTLADQAEASRFTELRKHLDERLDRLEQGGGASPSESPIARIDRLETALREHIDHAGNTLAAFIGEVDDRVERMIEASRRPGA